MESIIAIILIVFFAIIFHECAHGWIAYKLGDPTAKLAGRLTLNPLKHIDPVGTILVPAVLIAMRHYGLNTFVIGWAKPVPVNFMRLGNPKQDMIWVAMAGPIINIIMAILFAVISKAVANPQIYEILTIGVFVNLLLAIFNMVPVPPLDGSRLVLGLLPARLARPYSRLEPYGLGIVCILLFFGLFETIILPLIWLAGNLLGVRF